MSAESFASNKPALADVAADPPRAPRRPGPIALSRAGLVARAEGPGIDAWDLAEMIGDSRPPFDVVVFEGHEVRFVVRGGGEPPEQAPVMDIEALAEIDHGAAESIRRAEVLDEEPIDVTTARREKNRGGPMRCFIVTSQGTSSSLYRGEGLTARAVVDDVVKGYPSVAEMDEQYEGTNWDVAIWSPDHLIAVVQGRAGLPPTEIWLRTLDGRLIEDPRRGPDGDPAVAATAAEARHRAAAHTMLDGLIDAGGIDEVIDRLYLTGRYDPKHGGE